MISKKIGLLVPFMVCSLAVSVHAYKVEKGDSLYKIAKKHGTTAAKLAQLNGLDENAVLSLGQEIALPGEAPARTSARSKVLSRADGAALASVYTVEAGDTISGIAKKTGVSIAALLKANGFDEKAVIKPGQIINLPKGVEYTKPAVKFAQKPAPAGRTDMAGLALSLVGSRYVSGGTSRGGFDCSGLV
ncbi:MAG: LysM peptidoglycan-binding domain-containing protein, partial [Abditibacteriota bacterium]|nr:LysM peptidoglycan-binding domain-containing protein [Abditibacteriota bacterium]